VGRIPGGQPRLPGQQNQGLHRTFGLEMGLRYSMTEIILTPKISKLLLPPKVQRWQETKAYMV
jgi:hypothetical protein